MAFDSNDLQPHEQFVVDRIRDGEVADFTLISGSGEKPAIRAGFLRKLLLKLEPAWTIPMPGVRIKGARIEGALDLSDCSGAGGDGLPALELNGCDIPEPIDLNHARLARLSLDHSRLVRLNACEARFDGPVSFDFVTSIAETGVCSLDFEGAHVGGSVEGRGAKLKCDPEEPHTDGIGVFALTLRNTRIEGNVILRPKLKALGGVSLHGAKVGGLIDLRGALLTLNHRYALSAGSLQLAGALHLNKGFRCEGPIFLRGAKIGDGVHGDGGVIVLEAGAIHDALNAESSDLAGGVSLRSGFSANGVINFRGARIGGGVHLGKAKFASAKGYALDFRAASIEGDVEGDASVQGAIAFAGASIGRNLDLQGAEIVSAKTGGKGKAEYARAIDAANVRVGGAGLFQGASIKGEVFLADARVEGYLAFGGGRFLNNHGWAIRAPNVRVGGNLTIKIEDGDATPFGAKTVIEGGAKFDRAQVEGAFAWLNLELRGQATGRAKGALLSLHDINIHGALEAGALQAQDALIDLSGGRCSGLVDDTRASWGAETALLNIEGFSYERLEGNGRDDRWKARLAWLKRARPNGFSPQPYAALANVYARAGQREDARRILLEQHDQRTRHAPGGPLTWLLSSLFGLLSGYGFAPIRAARSIAIFLLIGIAGVFYMDAQGALIRPDGRACAGAIEPALYAIDVALPIIDLGQESACAPGRAPDAALPLGVEIPGGAWRAFEGGALWTWAQALYALLGAVLTALAIITFSGVMKPKSED